MAARLRFCRLRQSICRQAARLPCVTMRVRTDCGISRPTWSEIDMTLTQLCRQGCGALLAILSVGTDPTPLIDQFAIGQRRRIGESIHRRRLRFEDRIVRDAGGCTIIRRDVLAKKLTRPVKQQGPGQRAFGSGGGQPIRYEPLRSPNSVVM